jgi:hypothetical protein
VRGTTRSATRTGPIEAAGIDAVVADPDVVATILDHVYDVALVAWLMGSAEAEPEVIVAIHGPRLERFLEKLVDTPVRGFIYEAAGEVQPHHLEAGASIVGDAAKRWRIPVEVVGQPPDDMARWTAAMLGAADRLTG